MWGLDEHLDFNENDNRVLRFCLDIDGKKDKSCHCKPFYKWDTKAFFISPLVCLLLYIDKSLLFSNPSIDNKELRKMPISKSEFESGKVLTEIEKDVIQFLELNPRKGLYDE